MLSLLALLAVGTSTDTLPNESAALEKLQAIWRAATGGGNGAPLAVSRRRSSNGLADLIYQNNDTISYRLADATIFWGQFARERDTSHMPVLIESLLRERAVEVLALLTPKRFTPRVDQSVFNEDRTEFWLRWSYVVDGYPTHRGPHLLALDARTSKPIRLNAPSFDWVTDPSVRPYFTEAACYQVAWAKYMQVNPIAVAPERRHGLRWVGGKLEEDPAELAKSTAPIAYWSSGKYRAHFAEKRAVLAYSFWFGWQNVLVDAVTGEAMLVWGVDLSLSRSSGVKGAVDSVTGRTWHLRSNAKASGTLKLVEPSGTKAAEFQRVGLVSDQLTLVGHYDPTTNLLWVDHPTGAKNYEVTGELARVLAKG